MLIKEKLQSEHYRRLGWLMALGGSGLVWLAIIALLS